MGIVGFSMAYWCVGLSMLIFYGVGHGSIVWFSSCGSWVGDFAEFGVVMVWVHD